MQKKYWLLLFFSAVLYALSFLFVEYCWVFIFCFAVPLFYLTCIKILSFVHGYIWAITVFSLQLSGGIYVIACMAGDAWLVGLILGTAMILYQSFFVALFFWCANRFILFFSLKHIATRLLVWTIILMLIIAWIDWYSLWIFGIQEGYPLMHPLIPLAQHPQLLVLLPIVGKLFLTFLLLLTNASTVVFLWYKNRTTFLCMLLVYIPWIGCWLYGISEVKKPDWLEQICSVSCMICSTAIDPTTMIKTVGRELKKIRQRYPEVTIVLMPESALNCKTLLKNCELMALWNEQSLGKSMHYIFGTSRLFDDKYYNTVCWVNNGKLQYCFDKRHAVLLSERLASAINWPWLQNVYFKDQQVTTISTNNRTMFALSDTCICVPYICSELFFNEYPDDVYDDITIFALINDSSFISPYASYIHRLLLLLARTKAIQWQREIVYNAYTQSVFIDKKGKLASIKQ